MCMAASHAADRAGVPFFEGVFLKGQLGVFVGE